MIFQTRSSKDGIILELKVDDTPEHALCQIKEKNYALRFQGKMGETQKYTGRILGAGISGEEFIAGQIECGQEKPHSILLYKN